MTTIKAKFRASTINEKMGIIYYQIIHGRSIRQIKTEYTIYSSEWSDIDKCIIIDRATVEREKQLKLINDKITLDIIKFYKLVKEIESKGCIISCDYLISEYKRLPKVETFFNYFKTQIKRLEKLNKKGTACNYLATFNSFLKFREGEDLIFEKVTSDLLEEYEAFLISRNISKNSISFYMRILRAVYNKAADIGICEQNNPFKRVYTGIEKTVKRALTLKELKRIKEYKYSDAVCEYAIDMFLFSFYTRGMSFIDMAYLHKSNIKNGILSYRRRKTGQLLHIKWEACMQNIVNKYQNNKSSYLLPIINEEIKSTNLHNHYKNELSKVNKSLKRISKDIDLPITLTMYVASYHNKIIITTFDVNTHIISVVA